MGTLFSWVSSGSDNSPWTNVTIDGTATFGGSPVKKIFGSKTLQNFNQLGHYMTTPITAQVGYEYSARVEVDSTTVTDSQVVVMTDLASINYQNKWCFYISNTTMFVTDNGATNATTAPAINANQIYNCKFKIRADGGVDYYLDGVFIYAGAANQSGGGPAYGKNMRLACDMAKVNTLAGNTKWSSALITNGKTGAKVKFKEVGIGRS